MLAMLYLVRSPFSSYQLLSFRASLTLLSHRNPQDGIDDGRVPHRPLHQLLARSSARFPACPPLSRVSSEGIQVEGLSDGVSFLLLVSRRYSQLHTHLLYHNDCRRAHCSSNESKHCHVYLIHKHCHSCSFFYFHYKPRHDNHFDVSPMCKLRPTRQALTKSTVPQLPLAMTPPNKNSAATLSLHYVRELVASLPMPSSLESLAPATASLLLAPRRRSPQA